MEGVVATFQATTITLRPYVTTSYVRITTFMDFVRFEVFMADYEEFRLLGCCAMWLL
jgi:hypothetical protein